MSLADSDPFISISQSNALRGAEWEYARWFTNFNLRTLPANFVPKFYRPVTILKADLALTHRWPEIENWIEMLQRVFESLIYSPDSLLSRTGYTIHPPKITSAIASLLVFAYYRIKGKYGKKMIVNKATDYLLENHQNCIFTPSDGCRGFGQSTTITAMAVHAIAIANLSDSQEFLNNTQKNLLANQTKYGCWHSHGENPDYTTVLVLDALELTKGGDQLTFKMDLKLNEQAIVTNNFVSPKNEIPWIQVDYQTRRLTVGSMSVVLSGEIWELICELIAADQHDVPLAITSETRNWKSAVDMLRKKIGKENLKKVVRSVKCKTEDGKRKGAYKLTQDVRVTGHGQLKIRKTRQRK